MSENSSGHALRVGVVGCADIAIRRILPALVELESVELMAVASRDQAKADHVAATFGCRAIAGYHNLLERDDIDAVYIPLPPSMHHEWVARALRAGKHVLSEKPLATSYRQTVELVELAREHDLALAENYMFLHHSQHEVVRKMVDDDAIGKLQVFSSSFGIPPLHPASFRYQPGLGSGALLDVGVYPLRAAQLFLSAELEVRGASLRIGGTGVDVAGSALLRTKDGVTAQLDWGFEHSYRSTYALWGTRGRITSLRAFTPPEHHRPVVRLEQQDLLSEFTLAPDHQVQNTLTAFVEMTAAAADRPTLERALLEQALLVEQVREAAS
ncbi:Gfo/Idh/MocA family oxidoreductase [Nocardia salmonicida]|uniref:Gfo/Idh/MocA family protein n=1 Tax=Nocardia salmonicida TaxID=53431 RepID=UPI0033C50FD7